MTTETCRCCHVFLHSVTTCHMIGHMIGRAPSASENTCIAFSRLYRSSVRSVSWSSWSPEDEPQQPVSAHKTFFLEPFKHEASHGEDDGEQQKQKLHRGRPPACLCRAPQSTWSDVRHVWIRAVSTDTRTAAPSVRHYPCCDFCISAA